MSDRATPLSLAVIQAVAKHEGVNALDLERPLYEVVNPGALDDLFRDSRGRVTFDYLGYTVTVSHDGRVDVTST